jgi:hypothetical protein
MYSPIEEPKAEETYDYLSNALRKLTKGWKSSRKNLRLND